MKKSILFLVFLSFFSISIQQAGSQIPDDMNGRLYRLCKTWGYFKYFNQHKCEIKWDTLLNTTIKEVLLSTNNAEFNTALLNMFNKVGNNKLSDNPPLKPDTNINFNNTWINDSVFSQPVRSFLDTFTLYIYPDTSTCLIKINDYSSSYNGYIDFRNDYMTMSLNYNNEADRLTTMFYYWNVINYFSPYKNIMDNPWDSTLYQFIPQIRQAANNINFHKTLLKLVTKINDSHGFFSSSVITNNFWGGTYVPQIYLTRVGTKCVVTKVKDITEINKGDILTEINDISMSVIEDSLAKYVPASTPAALYRDIYSNMLCGTQNSVINLTLLDSNNNSYHTSTSRTTDLSSWYSWYGDNGSTASYFITTCGYGYVNMALLQPSEVPAMYDSLKNTRAIIFDIRNYPNGTLWDLGKLFFSSPVKSAIYYMPALTLNPDWFYLPGWYYKYDDSNNLGSWSNSEPYSGKVYILVNEETQSQAEYTTQYLSFHPKAKVIGTQTAGADGDISYITLPGGITTYFTSLGWYYSDGYQQQRNGVKIDSIVSPTIAGIRHGKDEILNAALDCLNDVEDSKSEIIDISVYPNPSINNINIYYSNENNTNLSLKITDELGNSVYEIDNINNTSNNNYISVNTSNFTSGVYFLTLKAGNKSQTKKFVIIR